MQSNQENQQSSSENQAPQNTASANGQSNGNAPAEATQNNAPAQNAATQPDRVASTDDKTSGETSLQDSAVSGGEQSGRTEQTGQMMGAANPFDILSRFQRDMDNIFEAFGFGRAFGGPSYEEIFVPRRRLGGRGAGRALPSARGNSMASGSNRALAQRPATSALWTPRVEAFTREDGDIVVRAELPGLRKEDVKLDVEDGVLTIHGERRRQTENEGQGFYRSEISYGSFERHIQLPEGADPSKIEANFSDGILEITIPKPPQERKSHSIEVK